MDIGFFGNLKLTRFSNIDKYVSSYVNKALEDKLGVLVCVGGISNDYLITKSFVTKLGDALKSEGIIFRFVVGNTDFYYRLIEYDVNKERKFRDILREYRNIEYYLPTHNINLKCKVRLVGLESWYDYSLYRGNGRDLKDITKKSFCGIKNRDVLYITNKSDYTQGLEETFDVRYSNECLSLMSSRLAHYKSSFGNTHYCIAVQYFLPVKSMLGNSIFERYMGTFKGSQSYIEPLVEYGVGTCIVGCNNRYKYATYKGVQIMSVNKSIFKMHVNEEV